MRIINHIRRNYRRYILVSLDVLWFCIIDFLLYMSALGSFFSGNNGFVYLLNSVVLVALMILFRIGLGVYETVWRYTNTRSYFNLILSDCFGGISAILFALFTKNFTSVWYYVIIMALTTHVSIMARLSYRLWYKRKNNVKINQGRKNAGRGCNVSNFDSMVQEGSHTSGSGKAMRDFKIEDLLFREPLKINDEQILEYYGGKTVMVTGGGGSIGSEICRQIARCNLKRMVIVDNYENNAYEIQQELLIQYGKTLDLKVEIASVQDAKHLERVFRNHRPDIVFHAAAHKHVPLMENSGFAAVKNNVMGTYNTANMAEKYGVKKFILVSTDKAVNPTSVMGATKRMCEMMIQCRKDSKTSFAAVRFGNVLDSNGSVIPLFKKQIAAGGPVTITDKRIIRYFMTIQEASQLLIQAGAMAKRGELFVLNMGKPVKIYDLAVKLIKLCGYQPGVDIQIKESGLRPGEKLYEELLIKTEKLDKTENEMIFIERDVALSRKAVEEKIQYLKKSALAWDEGKGITAREALTRVIPTFYDPNELNQKADASDEMKMMQE